MTLKKTEERGETESLLGPCNRGDSKWKKYFVVGIVWISLFCDYTLLTVVVPILPDYLKELGVSEFDIGFLFSSKAIFQIISNPFMGYIVDRFGPRIPLFLASIVLFLSTIMFAFAEAYWFLVLARSIQGVASGAIMSAGLAWISQTFHNDEERGTMMGIATSGLALGVVVGPPFGGLTYTFKNKEFPFLLISGIIALDIMVQPFIGNPIFSRKKKIVEDNATFSSDSINTNDGGEEEKHNKNSLKDITNIIMDPYILILCVANIAANSIIGMLEPTLPQFLEKEYRVADYLTGVVYLGVTISFTIGNLIWGRVGFLFGRWRVCGTGMLGLAVGLPLVAISMNVTEAVFSLILVGFSMSMVSTSISPTLAKLMEERHDPRYFGTIFAISDICNSLGFVIGPLIGSPIDEDEGFLIASVSMSALAVLPIPFVFAASFVRKEHRGPCLKRKEIDLDSLDLST